MLNVCAHRAMTIATEPCGNKSRFTCPYHGWMYSNDGVLRGVADQEKFGDFDKQANGLTQLPVYERGGMIFTVLEPGDEVVDFDDFLEAIFFLSLTGVFSVFFSSVFYSGLAFSSAFNSALTSGFFPSTFLKTSNFLTTTFSTLLSLA